MLVPQGLCVVLMFQSENEHGAGLPSYHVCQILLPWEVHLNLKCVNFAGANICIELCHLSSSRK